MLLETGWVGVAEAEELSLDGGGFIPAAETLGSALSEPLSVVGEGVGCWAEGVNWRTVVVAPPDPLLLPLPLPPPPPPLSEHVFPLAQHPPDTQYLPACRQSVSSALGFSKLTRRTGLPRSTCPARRCSIDRRWVCSSLSHKSPCRHRTRYCHHHHHHRCHHLHRCRFRRSQLDTCCWRYRRFLPCSSHCLDSKRRRKACT